MALYQIAHTCGHNEEVNITGTNVHGERERRAAWLESKPCRACERAAQSTAAQAVAVADRLPDLTGSEKQIAWAERIRAEVLASIDQFFAAARREAEKMNEVAKLEIEMTRQYQPLIVRVRSQTSASWWIDHRGESAATVLKSVVTK